MKSFLTSLLLWLPLLGRSQTPVQVVTKVIEKSLPYIEGQPIQINAQKADVTLKGWNRPMVSVKLRLIAKHPDRAVAEREVAYHQYVLQNGNGQIDLSNRFVIPQQAGKLKSQLKAVYEVSLPAKAQIALANSFGDLQLSNLSSDTNVTFEFGKLTLEDITGKLSVTSNYGDIDGRNLNATLFFKAEKADVTLQELSGTADLHCHYGKLNIQPAITLDALTIDAIRTDVLVSVKRLSDFRFDVSVSSAEIRVPEALSDQLKRQKHKQILSYQPTGHKGTIKVQNSYSNVIIQDEKSLVNR